MRLRRRPVRSDHRAAVGGLWDEMGARQFEFLVDRGLRPSDYLLDVGCGSLRGGVHFARYLEPRHYYGVDADRHLLDGGRLELGKVGLDPARVTLVHDDRFEFSRLGRTFSWAIAQSVFTHLGLNSIMRCLSEIERVLEPGGQFYATFFPSPGPRLGLAEHRAAEGVITHPDSDPFHYDPDIFRWAVEGSTLETEVIGEWDIPETRRCSSSRGPASTRGDSCDGSAASASATPLMPSSCSRPGALIQSDATRETERWRAAVRECGSSG